jgi:hypothetical protein
MSEVIYLPNPIENEDEETYSAKVAEAVMAAVDRSAVRLTDRLIRHSHRILTARRNEISGFQERLYWRWAHPLDLLELCIYLAFQTGKEFNKHFREIAAETRDYKFEALARLQAAAVRVADEIQTLLSAGFASGAHARWRTLHETAVVASFIGKESDEVAERYLHHEFVKAFEDAQEYQKHAEALGEVPFTPEEFNKIRVDFEAVLSRFGSSFAKPFGWAIPALEARDNQLKGQAIGFKQLQNAVDIEHWMPYYRMASHAVHPSTKFIRSPLGTRHSMYLLLPGRSNVDLVEPGQGAAIALGMAIAPLGTYVPRHVRTNMNKFEPALSIQAMIHAYARLIPLTLQAFANAHNQLEADIEEQGIESES